MDVLLTLRKEVNQLLEQARRDKCVAYLPSPLPVSQREFMSTSLVHRRIGSSLEADVKLIVPKHNDYTVAKLLNREGMVFT